MTPQEDRIIQLGKELFDGASKSKTPLFSKDRWYRFIMDLSMKNEEFKTQMFRFVDVLPALKSSKDVVAHLKEYFADAEGKMPKFLEMGLGLGSLAPGLMAGTIRKQTEQMAKLFITAPSGREALPILKKARSHQKGFTIDILGEATLSEDEALGYQQKYLELIDSIAHDSKNWPVVELLDRNHLGEIPKVNVSVKLSSLYSQVNLKAWDETKEIFKERLRPIFRKAVSENVFINLDMEQYSLKDLTAEIFKELVMEEEFKAYPHWGIVLQAYLKDSYEDLIEWTDFAKERAVPITIRLVKGAYWDYEVIHAKQEGWEVPVYTNKKESDVNFEKCAKYLLDHYEYIHVAFASHNVRSLAAALSYAESINLNKRSFEIQMLYGMAEDFKQALAKRNYRVREYVTVGEMITGMAYLVRRLLENTANESFLRNRFSGDLSVEELLADPSEGLDELSIKPESGKTFSNLPLLDFAIEENRINFEEALGRVKVNIGKTYLPIIGGKAVETGNIFERFNPSRENELVGKFHLAGVREAENAVALAKENFNSWSQTPVERRAELIDKLSDILEEDRLELAALQTFEEGKPWSEADGDVGEAIDFCRYYANHMRELGIPKETMYLWGEDGKLHYQGRGVCVVIAPWNFPLAILTGMVAAALVAGNTVIMKPAEQSTIIAARLMESLQKAGFPDGVIHFLPGLGEEVGDFLVKHKDVSTIAFTGSKDVGLNILKEAHVLREGQQHVKNCIVEMGGKNAMIIDLDADLDEAVPAATYSAFGFAGQKCSALSRAIVLEEVYDEFLERLIARTASLKVSCADDPEAYCGPVVDKESFERIMQMIELGKSEANLAYQSQVPSGGYFVPLTIFKDVDPKAKIAQQEIFGPVLSVIKVRSVDEALEVANDTEYALTGGVFSRSPATIQKIKNNLQVGNLYINRTITGAMVKRHPFGGYKLSGAGSKTGGPDYLLQFLEARCITENTVRRGFAPSPD